MRAILPLAIAVVLAACGSPQDRGACGTSTDCPVGQYCARTGDGNVCWPDAVAPVVSGVAVTCAASPCLRDSTLQVVATISDDAEVLDARVTLDVGGPPVPLARSGSTWSATVPLRNFPFDHFSHGVVATVTARDGARNETSLDASGVATVTRLRWEYRVGGSSPLAVTESGTLGIPTSESRFFLMTWDGQQLSSVAVGVGLQEATAALSRGESFLVGSQDGNVYGISNPGTGWTSGVWAPTADPLRGSLAVTSSGTIIAVSDSGLVYAATSSVVRNSPAVSPFALGAIVDSNDAIFAVAGGYAHRLVLSPSLVPGVVWGAPVALGGTVLDPIACSSALFAIATTGTGGWLNGLSASGDPVVSASTATPSSGIAILADGSIIVPEQGKVVSRFTSTGSAFPSWQKPDLGAAARTPLVVTGNAPFVVPTARGAVHALRSDGSIAWSGQVSAGTASLQPGNIHTYDPTPGKELSLAYFAGSDGWLHAVIVDGKLDGAAPWPKAFHDPANTNRAGAQPW
jgi:hypothetical protein